LGAANLSPSVIE
jgi:hypothetical protein